MKKQIIALIAGSVMSTAAFAVEPAATPKALSDSQMDLVTAGTYHKPAKSTTITKVNQSQTNTNIGINPTIGANVAILSFGGSQNVGAYNPQSAGGVQVVR